MNTEIQDELHHWQTLLFRWRTVFASWQLGTRSDQDAECNAIKDHRHVTLSLRAEVNALTALLLAKGVISKDEFDLAMITECEHLCSILEKRFPGFTATEQGLSITLPEAQATMNKYNFPP
jgi:hypothetical protein